MTLAEIKTEIERLSVRERCELNAWLQNWEPDDWDRQMKTDASAGKLKILTDEAEDTGLRRDYRSFP